VRAISEKQHAVSMNDFVFFCQFSVKLMAVGLRGAHGRHAVKHVVSRGRGAVVSATTRPLPMAVKHVLVFLLML
jgi:hypothetical protein